MRMNQVTSTASTGGTSTGGTSPKTGHRRRQHPYGILGPADAAGHHIRTTACVCVRFIGGTRTQVHCDPSATLTAQEGAASRGCCSWRRRIVGVRRGSGELCRAGPIIRLVVERDPRRAVILIRLHDLPGFGLFRLRCSTSPEDLSQSAASLPALLPQGPIRHRPASTMHLGTLQVCFLLPLAAIAGKQLDPISNKIGWEQIWEDDCSARCGVGTRSLRVACVDDWMEQSDKSICTDAVGASTLATSEPCNVKCFYVDPLKGKDSNAGTSAAAAFLSVGACTAKASSPSDTTKHNTRCILLGTALYDKPQTGASGLADLWGVTIEPETGQTVVFDGTAPAVFASDWKTSGSIKVATLSATSTPTASRRPDVIVEGRAIQCAKQAAINDGGHDDKSGWATKRPPCFMWDPELSWVVGKRAFAYDDAVAFYESGTASLLDGSNSKNLPWFWFDQATRKLYVHPGLAQKQVDAGNLTCGWWTNPVFPALN